MEQRGQGRQEGKRGETEELVERLIARRKWCPDKQEVGLQRTEVERMCDLARDVFQAQPMLIETHAPIKIAGDIHGQYSDLLRLFEHCGWPKSSEDGGGGKGRYMFLGDYVDRGHNGLESILLLFAYKVLFPDDFFLLRGNHECAAVTKIYGFYDEMKRRFDVRLWKMMMGAFDWMPIAGLVDGSVLCMHGGLSPDLHSLDQIRQLPRPTDIPDYGLICDILWSDPNYDVQTGWAESARGLSFTFSAEVVHELCRKLKIELVCRAHQVVAKGYCFFAKKRLVTLFSAPNYCGEYSNDAAVLEIGTNLVASFHILRPSPRLNIAYHPSNNN